MAVRASDLRERVTYRDPVDAEDGIGGQGDRDFTDGATVWGRLVTRPITEKFEGGREVSLTGFFVTLRGDPLADVTKKQLTVSGKTLEVVAIDSTERGESHVLVCREVGGSQ